jgi:hypothetical protein
MSSAFGYQKGGDLEAGSSGAAGQQRALYPGMQESPELRWALIRKIYVILSLQLLLTAAVAAVVVKVRAIPHFFTTTNAGLGLYIFLIILPFIGEPGLSLLPVPFEIFPLPPIFGFSSSTDFSNGLGVEIGFP